MDEYQANCKCEQIQEAPCKNKDELMKELMAADFAAFDLQLYLNTHPYDMRALMMYRNATQAGNMLKWEYESRFGPLTARSAMAFPWQWTKSPWSWEKQACE